MTGLSNVVFSQNFKDSLLIKLVDSQVSQVNWAIKFWRSFISNFTFEKVDEKEF